MIDPEGAFYPPAAVGLGVPLSRLVIVRPGGRSDAVWAMEQALRCGSVGAVVGLLDSLSVRAARQLQLAAEAGGGIGLLVGREGRSVGVKFAAVRMVVEASGFAGVGGVPPVCTGGQAASGTRRTASNRSLTVAAQINGAGKDSLKGGTEIGISVQRRLVWVRLSRARPGVSMDVFMLELGDAAGDVCLPAVSGDRSGEGSGTPGRRWVAG